MVNSIGNYILFTYIITWNAFKSQMLSMEMELLEWIQEVLWACVLDLRFSGKNKMVIIHHLMNLQKCSIGFAS